MAVILASLIISVLSVTGHSRPSDTSVRDMMLSKLTIVNSTAPFPTDTDRIPTSNDYIWWHSQGVWYTAISKEVSWYEAEKLCRAIQPGKTNMATIKTAAEQETLFNAQKSLGSDLTWIGALKVEETSSFYWYTNKETMIKLETMPVTYWATTQPDNENDSHICIYMDKSDGHWHDWFCANTYYAFCEYRF